jgi:hypothetical protein
MAESVEFFNTDYDCNLKFNIRHIHTNTYIVVSTVTSSMPLSESGFQRQIFPFLRFPEFSNALDISF